MRDRSIRSSLHLLLRYILDPKASARFAPRPVRFAQVGSRIAPVAGRPRISVREPALLPFALPDPVSSVCLSVVVSHRPSRSIPVGPLGLGTFSLLALPPVPRATCLHRIPRWPRTSGRLLLLRPCWLYSRRRHNPGRPSGTSCRTGHKSGIRVPLSLSCVMPSEVSKPYLEGFLDSRQSPGCRFFRHRTRTEAPSLHRRYSVSSVLRTSPPPTGTGLFPHGSSVVRHARASRRLPVLRSFPLTTCRHPYSGRNHNSIVYGAFGSPHLGSFCCGWQPSLTRHKVGSCICFFRSLLDVHSRYGLRTRGVSYTDPFYSRLRQDSPAAGIATGW
jgi:hypothetical protein